MVEEKGGRGAEEAGRSGHTWTGHVGTTNELGSSGEEKGNYGQLMEIAIWAAKK
jgi:hypothetical protein